MHGHGTFLWIKEAQGFVNTQNCRAKCKTHMAKGNPFQMQTLPLHFPKVSVRCRLKAAFIISIFLDLVTFTINETYYESLLCNQLISVLQQCRCVDITILMQDGTPPYIATPLKQLLNLHFGNDRLSVAFFKSLT
ncbi:uncharacterized protein CEXT_300371 [Caerostris extrusa]|uniref:Transposase n=1 Tax=Caerostris extrusa TaxID=172846 RepID=A0AAV4N3V3_CAEEX|nr:uncharacterized protein CEXT_300371 [Caerostris extrusa]